MARVNQRLWKIPGQRTKRKAWGFTTQIGGKQVRRYRAEWSREEAEAELAKTLLKIEPGRPKAVSITFGQAIDRYLAAKARKRSLHTDRNLTEHLKAAFGGDTPLAEITANRISEYKAKRLTMKSNRRGADALLSPAAVNRPLQLLRHLLRLAHEEWEVLHTVPKIRLEREPQERLRWLKPEEGLRLLAACGKSRNTALSDLVEFALFTGVRKGEALGLTWDRVDRSRGVILLEITKSGQRREVKLNTRADAVLARRWKEGATGPVFGSRKWNTFRTAWETAVAASRIADLRFHDLRHTFASWLAQKGRPMREIQDLLGHHSAAMTQRYAHLSPENQRAAVAVLDNILPTATVFTSAQASTHEVDQLVEVSQKSLK
jgi:integrase